MFNSGNNNYGYTLIEILIVISIIGFVASVSMYFLNSARENGRIAGAKQFSSTVTSSLSDNPVSYWSFDSGDATDSWGQNHGTLTGTNSVEGVANGALEFNGTTDGISVPDSGSLDITGSITISLWVYPYENIENTRDALITKRFFGVGYKVGLDNEGFCDNYTGDGMATIGFHYGESGGLYAECSNDGIVPVNKWSHIAISYNDTNKEPFIYFDGKRVASNETRVINDTTGTNNNPLQIANGFDTPFKGMIDEVRIYDDFVSFTKIQQLYAEGAKKFNIAIK